MQTKADGSSLAKSQLEQKLEQIRQEIKSCRSTVHRHITEESFQQDDKASLHSSVESIRVIHDFQTYMQAKVNLLMKENEYRKYQNKLEGLQDQMHASFPLKNVN